MNFFLLFSFQKCLLLALVFHLFSGVRRNGFTQLSRFLLSPRARGQYTRATTKIEEILREKRRFDGKEIERQRLAMGDDRTLMEFENENAAVLGWCSGG